MPLAPSKPHSLGIMSVATNVYLDYWMDLARSIDQHVTVFSPITLHVFTDRASEAKSFSRELTRTKVKVHEIEPLGWPEATLFRFKLIRDRIGEMPEEFLMYLDADTIVDADFESDLARRMLLHGVHLVEQSGSWRPPRLIRKIRFYALHPGAPFADLRKLIREGGLGTWETNRESTAYVPRNRRKHYVYGAVWMGPRLGIQELVEELAHRVEDDWTRGVIAVWHDESHINWWNSQYTPRLLDPRYYFFPGHRHLDELPRIVSLIHKTSKTR